MAQNGKGQANWENRQTSIRRSVGGNQITSRPAVKVTNPAPEGNRERALGGSKITPMVSPQKPSASPASPPAQP